MNKPTNITSSVRQRIATIENNQSNQSTINIEAISNSAQIPQWPNSNSTTSALNMVKEYNLQIKNGGDISSSITSKIELALEKTKSIISKQQIINQQSEQNSKLELTRYACLATLRQAIRELITDNKIGLSLENNTFADKEKLHLVKHNLLAFFKMSANFNEMDFTKQEFSIELQERLFKESGMLVHKDKFLEQKNSAELMLESIQLDGNSTNLTYLVTKFGGSSGCFNTLQRAFFEFTEDDSNAMQRPWDSNISLNENMLNCVQGLKDFSSATAIYQGLLDADGLMGNKKAFTEDGVLVEKIVTAEDIISFFAYDSVTYYTVNGLEEFFENRTQDLLLFEAKGGSFD